METQDTFPPQHPTRTDAPGSAPRPVVVGLADTEESDRAVAWGADHARRIGAPLHLVHAFVWPLMNVDVDPVPGIAGSGLRAAAEHLLDHAVGIAREQSPDLAVTAEIRDGRSADVLLAAAKDAQVLAVGSRGLGRVMAMVMGSTSLTLARRADCPVVVVRGDALTDGPIGVAYESSELGGQALDRAGELAALHGTHVDVVIGVSTPNSEHPRILAAAERRISAAHPDIEVCLAEVAAARDARALVRASEGVRTLVVAARGEGASSASSQTTTLVQYAHTPVWIERPLRSRSGAAPR